jgi:hypothetical protein
MDFINNCKPDIIVKKTKRQIEEEILIKNEENKD